MRPSATGNNDFGYFGGGGVPTTSVSLIQRIDYSNDTATASLKGPLDTIIDASGATGGGENGLPQFGA